MKTLLNKVIVCAVIFVIIGLAFVYWQANIQEATKNKYEPMIEALNKKIEEYEAEKYLFRDSVLQASNSRIDSIIAKAQFELEQNSKEDEKKIIYVVRNYDNNDLSDFIASRYSKPDTTLQR